MRTVTIYSIPAGSIFFFFASDIATLLYGNAESAEYIKALATVTPFMYIETVSDGLLKSIGEESRVFRYGVSSVCGPLEADNNRNSSVHQVRAPQGNEVPKSG